MDMAQEIKSYFKRYNINYIYAIRVQLTRHGTHARNFIPVMAVVTLAVGILIYGVCGGIS